MTEQWYNEGGYLPPAGVWTTPVEDCPLKNYIHRAHELLEPSTETTYCPGLGYRYEV